MAEPALIVVDVQRGFNKAAHWGRRNNPAAEANMLKLLAAWRETGRPVVLVRHDSLEEGSPLAPGQRGNELQSGIDGAHDVLIVKHVNSAFHGEPDLDAWLRGAAIDELVVCGITTNHCCETTARVGANLGYRVRFALDATYTFDRRGPDGTLMSADELTRATATSLHGEFAEITSTADLLASVHGG